MNTNQLSTLTNLLSESATNGLRDIKPPVEIPSGWAWVWWALGALAVIATGILLWKFLRHRSTQRPVVVIPPHKRARQKLNAALQLIDQPKPFCILVSDTIRVYLEERFQLRAPERTTEEFLHELQHSDLLNPPQKAGLADFLEKCDLVKFAKLEPTQTELQALHDSAMRLVDETEPAMAPPETVAA